MRAIVYEGPESIALRDVPEPDIADGLVKIKVAYAGICGGDMGVYAGVHPRAKAPLIMGHEFSGTVCEHPILPKGTHVVVNPLKTCGTCTPCKTGDSHVCQTLRLYGFDASGAMADFIVVHQDNVVQMPASLDLKAGAFAEPVAVVVHAIRETGYAPGDSAVVFGAGPIGLAQAIALRAYGCTNLTLVEVNENRCNFAMSLGFDVANPNVCDVLSKIQDRTSGIGADYVFDCAGGQSCATLMPSLVRIKGKIVIVAAYKKKPEFDFFSGMIKEFSIHFVRVYRVRDFEIAVELLERESDFAKLITHVLTPCQFQEGFDMMQDSNTCAVKIVYDFSGA